MRRHCTDIQAQAHDILDRAKDDQPIDPEVITAALILTGDLDMASMVRQRTAQPQPESRTMRPLHPHENRCLGRDPKRVGSECPQRDTCRRHLQLEIDRLPGSVPRDGAITMRLPRVGKLACHYRLADETKAPNGTV